MQGKSTVDSGRLMEINAQSMGEHSADLGRVIVELGTINMEKVELLVKSGRGKHLWYGLMKKTTGTEDRYDAGDISIKERNIPRPKRQARSVKEAWTLAILIRRSLLRRLRPRKKR